MVGMSVLTSVNTLFWTDEIYALQIPIKGLNSTPNFHKNILLIFVLTSGMGESADLSTVKDERATVAMIKHLMHQLPN